jgi:hypothetical protein
MRGKRINLEFISNYITSCINKNAVSSTAILAQAKKDIEDIDKKIIEAEQLKILRSKLLDVVSTFELSNNRSKDRDILKFISIKHLHICKKICNYLNISNINIADIDQFNCNKEQLLFTIKQLQDFKIIKRIGQSLVKGDHYYNYNKFISQIMNV